MMKRILTVSLLILAAASLRAQNVIDLIISEAMVDNTSSVVDDFGEHTPWVEVFNTDREEYGGTGLLNGQRMVSSPGECHGQKQFITLRLPWLGAIVLAPKSAAKKKSGK